MSDVNGSHDHAASLNSTNCTVPGGTAAAAMGVLLMPAAAAAAQQQGGGMISLADHHEALQKQQALYEERFNVMRTEINRLTALLSTTSQNNNAMNTALRVEGQAQEDDTITGQRGGGTVVEGSSRTTKPSTPRKSRKRKAATTTTSAAVSATTTNEGGSNGKSTTSSTPTNKQTPPPPSSSSNKLKRKRVVEEKSSSSSSFPETNKNNKGPTVHEIKWNSRYDELLDYKETHGNINVTRRSNLKLYSWISVQRTEHRRLRQGKITLMTPERIQKLDKIPGWEWTVMKEKPADWETRFQQLIQFQKEHGHTNVPQHCEQYPKLGNFVLDQRRLHKAYTLGKIGTEGKGGGGRGKTTKNNRKTTQERIAKLESIGFIWSLRNRGGWKNSLTSTTTNKNDRSSSSSKDGNGRTTTNPNPKNENNNNSTTTNATTTTTKNNTNFKSS